MPKQKLHLNEKLAEQFLQNNGPIVSGKALWEALGFRSASAFRQAKLEDRLGINVFKIPNRGGNFAYAEEVAAWLRNLKKED